MEGNCTVFEDKTIVCKDCGKEFVFTAGEQEFYAQKGFQNAPIRCKGCRDSRKAQTGSARPARQLHDAVCHSCGAATKVPFVPQADKPVYCRDCFARVGRG